MEQLTDAVTEPVYPEGHEANRRLALRNEEAICNHIFPKGRHCRQAVASPGDLYCATHSGHTHLALKRAKQVYGCPVEGNPLAELAEKLGPDSEAADIKAFIGKTIQLACQNRISMQRAGCLTFMANSLLGAIRLANHEARLYEKDNPQPLKIDWTGIPRPDREKHLHPEISTLQETEA